MKQFAGGIRGSAQVTRYPFMALIKKEQSASGTCIVEV